MIRSRQALVVLAISTLYRPASAASDASQRVTDSPRDAKIGADPDFLPEPPHRRVTFELTPLNFEMRFYGGEIEVIPVSHHALQLAAYYFNWTTGDDSNDNTFRGVKGEIGYRYYFGDNGPRGFFLGPSFLAGVFEGLPKTGEVVDFQNYGGAFDIGYQALLFDRLVLGLGLGAQYTVPTVTIPQQELPASIVANRGLRPRLLASIGVAF